MNIAAIAFIKSNYLVAILCLTLLAAAISDYRSQRIPNALTFSFALVAIIIHTCHNGLDGLLFAIYGMVTGTLLLIVPYMMGGMGAGDAKLMGMVGAFLGVKAVFTAFLFTALCGGVYAVGLVLIKRKAFKDFFRNQYEALMVFLFTKKYSVHIPKGDRRPRLCYGIAIALGTYLFIGLDLLGVDLFW